MHLLLASPFVDSKMVLRPVILHSSVTCWGGRRRSVGVALSESSPQQRTERVSTNSRIGSAGRTMRRGTSPPAAAAGTAAKAVAIAQGGREEAREGRRRALEGWLAGAAGGAGKRGWCC